MAEPLQRLIKKVRRLPKKPLPPPEPLWKQFMARREAEEYRIEFWERDKIIKRDANFEKAKVALEAYREEQRLEKLRQEEIAEQRLKNLKKARRKLRKLREE